jgi:hypothetical protein
VVALTRMMKSSLEGAGKAYRSLYLGSGLKGVVPTSLEKVRDNAGRLQLPLLHRKIAAD